MLESRQVFRKQFTSESMRTGACIRHSLKMSTWRATYVTFASKKRSLHRLTNKRRLNELSFDEGLVSIKCYSRLNYPSQ